MQLISPCRKFRESPTGPTRLQLHLNLEIIPEDIAGSIGIDNHKVFVMSENSFLTAEFAK